MRLRTPRSDGFNLIELTVVILVIATLAALLVPAASRTIDKARNAQAKNDLTQIVTAVNAYYTEYGKYPIATTDTVLTDAQAADLFYTLRAVSGGVANLNNAANPRVIVFLTVPDAKSTTNPREGIVQQDVLGAGGVVTVPKGTFVDPWGTTYKVEINGTYNNQVPNPYATNAGAAQLQQGVIAWSFGKDQQSTSVPGPAADKNAGTAKDDIISWQ